MPGSHLFNLGLYQKKFCSTSRVTGGAINMGCTKGRGSTTRMFNYCNERSANPSGCINQFVTFPSTTCIPSEISLSSIATYYQDIPGPGPGWILNPGATVSKCQTLNIPNGGILINTQSSNTFTNNGTINMNYGALGNFGSGLTFINNGTINIIDSQGQLGNFGNGISNFINNSYININYGQLVNYEESQITNNGYITLNNNSNLTNTISSTFDNNGQIKLNNGSSISNENASSFTNNNTIIDINGSSITNVDDGSMFYNSSGNIYIGPTTGSSPCSSGTVDGISTNIINSCGP